MGDSLAAAPLRAAAPAAVPSARPTAAKAEDAPLSPTLTDTAASFTTTTSTSSDDAEAGAEALTCFVCTEATPPLYRVCRCSTAVHKKCLEEMIRKVPAHQQRCAICTEPYEASIVAVGLLSGGVTVASGPARNACAVPASNPRRLTRPRAPWATPALRSAELPHEARPCRPQGSWRLSTPAC